MALKYVKTGLAVVTLFLVTATIRADVFDLPEAEGYDLVYSLTISNAANYGATGVTYLPDNHLDIPGPFDRIAYYLELAVPGGSPQYVFVSMEAFTQDLRLIGIPTAANGAFFQRNVRDMIVTSNVSGLSGTTPGGGNIEFWRSNYATDNVAGTPSGNGATYDVGDNAGGPGGSGTYGSFQIHNHDTGKTLIAYNRWNDGVTHSDLGIGNNTQLTGDNRVNTDWTFRSNAGSYDIKKLHVLVRQSTAPPTRTVVLPLGDSITYGAGGTGGGYRDRLFSGLTAAGRSFEFIGSAGDNPSIALSGASLVHHEGHGGYRVDQIANNLSGNDGTGGNRGGFWFNPGVQPNVILLHIGTNDIWQRYNPGARGKSAEKTFMANLTKRLDSLVNQMTIARPNAQLLVAGIIPMNKNSGNRFLNDDVQAYNNYIQHTLVPKYQNLGRHVTFVDQYANFVNTNGTIKATLLPDGVHPNQAGYDLMGNTWSEAIESLFP